MPSSDPKPRKTCRASLLGGSASEGAQLLEWTDPVSGETLRLNLAVDASLLARLNAAGFAPVRGSRPRGPLAGRDPELIRVPPGRFRGKSRAS